MKTYFLLASLALLTGCTVGPNYGGPPAVVAPAAAFHRAGDLGNAAGSGPVLARWWTSLNDGELDRLEDLALAGSPDLAIAEARLRQSRAGLNAARANLWPTTGTAAAYLHVDGGPAALLSGPGGGSQGASGAKTGADASAGLYSANFDAIWEVDLFGGTRRAIEGARAQAQAAEAQAEDARVTLTAEVAQAYVQLRDLQHRVALAQADARTEQDMLALTRQRRAGGTASDLDVERLTTQFETTRAAVTPLQAQISEQLDRLAVLTGQAPGALDTELAATAPLPLPPAQVAVGDPASLLQRRPDIRAAERQLAASTAAVGQKAAGYFPKLTLLGTLGWTSPKLGNLFDSDNRSSIQAPLLQWTPFDFGRTRAGVDQAKAQRDEAEATYRRTVLTALQDAETSLSRYGRERDALADQLRVQASADRAAQLMDLKVRGGTATTLDELDAERNRIEARSGVADAQALLTQDYIALQKSLGLGWQ
jgi:NodT family efflux transporter outer membrane factor (OMF) lipoprotein